MDGLEKRANRPRSRQSIAHLPSHSKLATKDKQNTTVDLSMLSHKDETQGLVSKKKTRGKSLGPGGLEALKDSVDKSLKTAVSLQVKSILKPTVPLTPPKHIPSFDELRKRNTNKAKSPTKNGVEDLLIDFSTPAPSREVATGITISSAEDVLDPFSPRKDDTVKHGQVPIVELEDDMEKKRQSEKDAILERRAARRKSMANRRVSFAPEATLHTWSVMELGEDSTTSSAANSTRRQSGLSTTPSLVKKQESDPVDPPSTPPEQVEEPLIEASPAHQRDLHQTKRRRSSALSAELNVSEQPIYSSSPSGDITSESSPVRVEDSMDSESDTDGDTAMSMDEVTSNTMNSQASVSSTHSSLDERLRQAASSAGTRGIVYDEHGDDDLSMDMVTGTVTSAFQPWVKGQQGQPHNIAMQDQENKDPTSPAQKSQAVQAGSYETDDDTQGMTMDVTKAIGGIIPNTASPTKSRRKSVLARRRSSMARRQSHGEESNYGDETMDFTAVGGGILVGGDGISEAGSYEAEGSDSEMTMEFTTAVGGLREAHGRRQSTQSEISEENDTMDMTAAVGGILEVIEEQTEPQTDVEDDKTAAMDITRAVGHIVSRQDTQQAGDPVQTTKDVTYPELSDIVNKESNFEQDVQDTTSYQITSTASEAGSPGRILKPRLSGRPQIGAVTMSNTPGMASRSPRTTAPATGKTSTPTKQLTPLPSRARTPERTPVTANVTHRGASPRKLFQSEIKARASPASAKREITKKHDPLFSKDAETGHQTPRVVLHAPKPHQHLRRRSSGVGIDKDGFGSPRVSELLDRRMSIGDAAPEFKLQPVQKNRLRFANPRELEQEVDNERSEEERRESGRFLMEQEANEQQEENATLQLKDLIESMSPKKDKAARLKGRKSLAVGSAKGLLGKRPAELDSDDDEGSENTPKRLKAVSREGSPVKRIHLPKPPSKEETTGRLTRAQQIALAGTQEGNTTPASGSPSGTNEAASPQQANRFRNLSAEESGERPTSFEDKLDNVMGAIDASITHPGDFVSSKDEDKISLQQFLNMTNIHFIELSTTKRRHTMAQSIAAQTAEASQIHTSSTEESFVAAATTLPLLDLYQHATRELKTYISTGRKIIRSIEADTLAEQPRLFREYVDARPDIKIVMDNQFRNGKTNARLQSKEGWYTWRSQLVDGLRDGLQGIKDDLDRDQSILQLQQESLDKVVPKLTNQYQGLDEELSSLHQRMTEIESIDHEALQAGRQELRAVEKELEEKRALLETLQQQMKDKDEALGQAAELKTEMQDQISEANRVREENRGWPAKEVLALKVQVDKARKETGWRLVAAEEDEDEPTELGIALTLTYRDELRLLFYPSAYQSKAEAGHRRSGRRSRSVSGPTAPISLTHIPSSADEKTTQELPTERRFFLQLIRSQLHAFAMMPKGTVNTRTILDTVSGGWDLAKKVSEEIRLLSMAGITRVAIQGDEILNVKLMLMAGSRSRVDFEYILSISIPNDGQLAASTNVHASAVYGSVADLLDVSKTRKVQKALTKEVECKTLGKGAWISAIHGFEDWRSSQGQTKPMQPKSEPVPAPSPRIEATTPQPVSKSSAVKRSPLAVKKTALVQKKALPVPTTRQQKIPQAVVRDVFTDKHTEKPVDGGKENVPPTPPTFDNLNVVGAGFGKPAIPPDMQEAMMHTPIKRVGALRRSPI